MEWVRKLSPWVALLMGVAVAVVAVYFAMGYLNALRSRADAAERKAEAAQLTVQGFAVAADASQKKLDQTAAANQVLQAEIERIKKASGAHVVGTVSGTTHVIALPVAPVAPGSGGTAPALPGDGGTVPVRLCAIFADEPIEIRLDGAALKTEGGNLVLAGVASLWLLPRGETETRKILDAPLTLKVQAAAPEKALGWGAGLMLVGFSAAGTGGYWVGPIVSPPSVSFLGLDLSVLLGGGAGGNGAWGGMAGGLVRW